MATVLPKSARVKCAACCAKIYRWKGVCLRKPMRFYFIPNGCAKQHGGAAYEALLTEILREIEELLPEDRATVGRLGLDDNDPYLLADLKQRGELRYTALPNSYFMVALLGRPIPTSYLKGRAAWNQ
jgi:hypothetical protein